jgi:hypothetical protein
VRWKTNKFEELFAKSVGDVFALYLFSFTWNAKYKMPTTLK